MAFLTLEADSPAIQALNEKIEDLEKELFEAQRAASRIAWLESTLRALRQSRAVLTGEKWSPPTMPPPTTMQGAISAAERAAYLARNAHVHGQDRVLPGMPPPPLPRPVREIGVPTTTLIMSILREAGRPLHVGEIMAKLRERGCEASQATIVGTLSRFVKDGKAQRPEESTYVSA